MHLSLDLDNSTTGGYFETPNQVEHSCYQTKYYKSRLENSVAGASSVIITSDNYNLPRKKINTLSRGEYSYRVSLRLAFPSRGPQLARPSLRGPAQARASWSTRNVHKATNAKSAARGVRQKAHTSHRSQPRKSRRPRTETIVLPKTSAAVDRSLH